MPKISPKNFYHLTIAYIALVVPLGLWLADPLMIFVSLIPLLPTILFSKAYLKPPISPNFPNIFWLVSAIVMITFLMQGQDITDSFVENKNQLQQITGVIPENNTYIRYGRSYSTTYLKIADKAVHCADNTHDDCHKIYQYKGQPATVWYQPNTTNGNLAYEIQVNNLPIYEFDSQKALFIQQKNQRTHQWIWTFVLLGLPTLWLGWIDRKIRKSLPTMTKEEFEVAKKQQLAEYEPVGCLGLIFCTIFVGIAICCFLYTILLFMQHTLDSAIKWAGATFIFSYLTYLSIKPKKKNLNKK